MIKGSRCPADRGGCCWLLVVVGVWWLLVCGGGEYVRHSRCVCHTGHTYVGAVDTMGKNCAVCSYIEQHPGF